MVAVIPNGFCSVDKGAVTPVVQVIFEQSHSALSEVSELHFLHVDFNRVFKSVSVNDNTEISLVVEVSRAADVIKCRYLRLAVFVSSASLLGAP